MIKENYINNKIIYYTEDIRYRSNKFKREKKERKLTKNIDYMEFKNEKYELTGLKFKRDFIITEHKKYRLVYKKMIYSFNLDNNINYNLNDKNFFINIIEFGLKFEEAIINIIREEKITIYEYINSFSELIMFLMMNKKAFNCFIEKSVIFFNTYGFISNVNNINIVKDECNILILIMDILCIYTCFYLFIELQKEKEDRNFSKLLLFSLLYKKDLESNAVSFINNYLKFRENISYIKYTSTYDSNQKIWKQEAKYDNVIQKSILQLRNILSTNYSGIDYYICENCGEPFIRVSRNQKIHNIEQNYECRKDYDRKRQKKSYYKKRANTI